VKGRAGSCVWVSRYLPRRRAVQPALSLSMDDFVSIHGEQPCECLVQLCVFACVQYASLVHVLDEIRADLWHEQVARAKGDFPGRKA